MKKFGNVVYFVACCLMLTGCASVDPFERVNRKIFAFNMALDKVVVRPVARAYEKVMPSFVVCRIENFFNNLDDLTNIANNVLQCKFLDAWSDCWRFAFNSTFGLVGFFDVATCAGLPKHRQDFGLTLARYGFVNSPYLMVPFLGPATIRDALSWAVDWQYLSVWRLIELNSFRYGLYGSRLIHRRAGLLPADKLIGDAIDPYLFVRDAYLQKRECDIKSICPPDETPTEATAHKVSNEDTFVEETVSEKPTSKDKKPASKRVDDPFVAE
jgi:phospholipid-binding lipoprotein MlaA